MPKNSILLRYYPFLAFFFLLVVAFDMDRRDKLKNIIWSDAEGYYMYLPAIFIYGGFEKVPVITDVQFTTYPGTDKIFTKYTYGVALLEAPFFLGAHLLALRNRQPADGYSPYYKYGLLVAGAFYAFLGIWFLRQVLNRRFPPGLGLLTLFALLFGTNLYYYAVGEPGMSHVYSFALFAALLYLTPAFYNRMNLQNSVLLGLLTGLIVLIRPTNILVLLYVLLFDIRSWKDLKERFRLFRENLHPLWIIPLAAFLVFVPQFIYWKYISGDFFIYSYGEEGFTNLTSPLFMHVLFDITNGWLLFTPLVVFAIFGLYLGCCDNRHDIPVITLISFLSLYLFASWWNWWFGGAYGYRSMIEFYALLAIPMAYYFREVFVLKRNIWRSSLVIFSLFLMVFYCQELIAHKYGPHYDWESWYRVVDGMFPYWEIDF